MPVDAPSSVNPPLTRTLASSTSMPRSFAIRSTLLNTHPASARCSSPPPDSSSSLISATPARWCVSTIDGGPACASAPRATRISASCGISRLQHLPDDRARLLRLPRAIRLTHRHRPLHVEVHPSARLGRTRQHFQGQRQNAPLHHTIVWHPERVP